MYTDLLGDFTSLLKRCFHYFCRVFGIMTCSHNGHINFIILSHEKLVVDFFFFFFASLLCFFIKFVSFSEVEMVQVSDKKGKRKKEKEI